ncbi:MAG: circularly permuted type 2 ATP-grasp protein [Bacteroidetes bacterium]|nr:circularly permuted type 2 ATP-grasp protein [Bacteroidota bacterium]
MINPKIDIKAYNHYPNTWDEMYISSDDIRNHYQHFTHTIKSMSLDDLNKKVDFSSQLFLNQGVTFTVYNNSKGTEKIFPFDIIPRIITAKEWTKVERGIKQRIKALNLFIKDTYFDKFIYKDGVVPFKQILSSSDYLLQMNQLSVPGDIYSHIAGVDLIRDNDGEFYVLEDNLRTPSGVSYMIENREISKRIFPAALSSSKVMPITNYAQMLSKKLKGLSPKSNPNVVLLTPGIYNSAYYEHTTLARLMGVELVEGQDLFVDDNFVFMKNAGAVKKVDVIYRRVDDDFLDPLVFNSNSKLGVSSIMSSYRKGNVAIVNAPGTGFADDKATYTYVPDMIRYYLNEEPILKNIQTYKLSNKSELEYVLQNIDSMVIKKTDGSGGYGMLIGNSATDKEIHDYKKQVLANPKGFIAQPTLNLSTSPCFIDGKLAPRCVDFRPFALMGNDGIDVCPGGLTRVALKEGSLVVNSSQGGGSKDTWVLKK